MILEFLAQNGPLLKEVVGDAAMIVAGASAITAATGTPDPKTVRGKVYRVVEVLGLVVGRAKEAGLAPAADPKVEAGVNAVVDLVRQALAKAPATAAGRILLVGMGLGLGGCAGGAAPVVTPRPADPAVTQKITKLCVGSGLFKLVDTIAFSAVPVPGVSLAPELINSGVDAVCRDPGKFAGDVSTVEWLVKNLAAKAKS